MLRADVSPGRALPTHQQAEALQLVTPDGVRRDDPVYDPVVADVDDEQLLALYEDMVVVRRFDTEAVALQRQGQLGLWPPLLGQEAAQIGSARALRSDDFVFSSYRENGVAYCRGAQPTDLMRVWRGTALAGWDPRAIGMATPQVMIGSQTLHATGYALGCVKDGVDSVAVAYFGDGATSKGDVHEAMVFAATFAAPVIFFCQNNQWAISEPVGLQAQRPIADRAAGYGIPGIRVDGNDVLAVLAATRVALDRARRGDGPTFIEAVTYRMGPHTTSDDPTRYVDPSDKARVGGQGPDRADRTPADGPRRAVRRARRSAIKAKADTFADADARGLLRPARPRAAERLRGRLRRADTGAGTAAQPVRRLPRDVRRGGVMATMTLAAALNSGLRHALDDDPTVVLLGEDIGTLGGVFRVTDGLQRDFGVDRVMDTPLAEAGIMGVAVGLAYRGYRPVVEIQFDGFVYPAVDQLVTQVARIHYRTGGAVRMPITVRIPYGGGIGAVEHHSESPEAYFAHTPGPARGHLREPAGRPHDDPAGDRVRRPRGVLRAEAALLGQGRGRRVDATTSPLLDRARVVVEGTDVTLATYGPLVITARDAALAAQDDGLSVEVVDLRSLSPVDLDTLEVSVRKTGRLVVSHEAQGSGGLGAEIVASITDRCFDILKAAPARVTGFDTPYPAAKVEEHFLPDLDRMLDAVDRVMGRQHSLTGWRAS